jgi:hypothetical protein
LPSRGIINGALVSLLVKELSAAIMRGVLKKQSAAITIKNIIADIFLIMALLSIIYIKTYICKCIKYNLIFLKINQSIFKKANKYLMQRLANNI